MLLNKKCIYLGVSLFSAMILGSVSNQTVKADTTGDSTSTSSVAKSASTTVTQTAPATSYVTPTGTVVKAQTATAGTKPILPSVAQPATNPTVKAASVTPTITAPTDTTTPRTASVATPTVAAPTVATPKVDEPQAVVPTVATPAPTKVVPMTRSVSVTDTASVNVTNPASNNAGTSPTAPSPTVTSPTAPAPTVTSPTAAKPAATPAPDPYALPSDLTDDTVVNFADPAISSVVRSALGLQPTANVTVGDIKNYNQVALDLDEGDYKLPAGVSNQVESLNGLQYLTLLPSKTVVYTDFYMASDPNANTDLTPLENIPLGSLGLTGDFSAPNGKEIDPTQISELNLSKNTYLGFHGDGQVSINDGITNAQLKAMAPTIIKFSQNGQPGGDALYLGNSPVTDFTPLKPILSNPFVQGQGFYLSAGNMRIYDPTPVYAVKNQPITFTAEPNTGLDGEDLAATYHFSATAPVNDQVDDNLKYLGNDTYVLQNADSSNTLLSYGNLGSISSTPNDTYINKSYPNGATFIYYGMTVKPIIWQDHPNVTIEYVDQNDDPITVNGQPMIKTVDGVNIGDSYDLTPDSTVAGYTMTGTPSALKGTYTQAPQVVILTYKANPVVDQPTTSPTVKPTNVVKDVVNVTPQSTAPVQVYDDSGKEIPGRKVNLADITVQESALINGKRYYKIGNNEWVPASDYDSYTPETGVIRTFDADTVLVNSAGKVIASKLSPNTEWKYNKIITIKGKKYYEVATNEYLAVDSGVKFTPVKAGTTITTKSAVTVYNSRGQVLTNTLPANSSWKTDGSAVINGIPMCRVANDEWIPEQDIVVYREVKMNYTLNGDTPVYDVDGDVLPNTLKAGTSWKVDRIVTINGQEYYRVATNEYIKA